MDNGRSCIKTTLANERATIITILGTEKAHHQTNETPPLYNHEFNLTERDVDDFYDSLHEPPLNLAANLSLTLGEALSPSALLEYLARLNRENGSNYSGKNRSMDTNFHGLVFPGMVQIKVYRGREEPKKIRTTAQSQDRNYEYTFSTEIMQNNKIVAAPQIKCITNGTLELKTFG